MVTGLRIFFFFFWYVKDIFWARALPNYQMIGFIRWIYNLYIEKKVTLGGLL